MDDRGGHCSAPIYSHNLTASKHQQVKQVTVAEQTNCGTISNITLYYYFSGEIIPIIVFGNICQQQWTNSSKHRSLTPGLIRVKRGQDLHTPEKSDLSRSRIILTHLNSVEIYSTSSQISFSFLATQNPYIIS